MSVLSPITGKPSTRLIDKIPVDKILERYRRNLNMDVSRFFTGLQHVEVYECTETQYRFYYPMNLAGDSRFYEQLSTGGHDYYPEWKWENEIALQYIPDGSRVLDVGCGDGIFLKGLAEKRKVESLGLELNPDAITKCREKGLSVESAMIQDYARDHAGAFDVVTTFQVVEHIPEVRSFLEAKLKALRPGGTMIIGVPYSNPYLYRKDKFDTMNLPPHHMGLWNEHAFKNLEEIFKITLRSWKTSQLHDMLYYLSVQLNARDRYNHLFWNNGFARNIFRGVNALLSPFKRFYKGHDIIAVFEKNG